MTGKQQHWEICIHNFHLCLSARNLIWPHQHTLRKDCLCWHKYYLNLTNFSLWRYLWEADKDCPQQLLCTVLPHVMTALWTKKSWPIIPKDTKLLKIQCNMKELSVWHFTFAEYALHLCIARYIGAGANWRLVRFPVLLLKLSRKWTL